MNIEQINKMMEQETRHPLVTVVSVSQQKALGSITPDCYALLLMQPSTRLKLYRPGETFAMDECQGVLFHPDLLCHTRLEVGIDDYPKRCSCRLLGSQEQQLIRTSIGEIDCELSHSIDRFSRQIIVSRIALLLEYCTRFCENRK